MAKDPSDKDPKSDDIGEDEASESEEKGPRIAGLISSSDNPPGSDVALFEEIEEEEEDLDEFDQVLPALPLRNSVLYPGALMPLAVGRPKTLRLLNAIGTGGVIAIVSQKDKDIDEPSPEDLHWVGTAARILKVLPEDENTLHVVVQGLERIRATEFVQTEPYDRSRRSEPRRR